MTMDLTQASQMLKWLDEERRKDKQLIASLQERLEGQQQQIVRLEGQLANAQKAIVSLEGAVSRITDLAQALEKAKLELSHTIEGRDEQYRKDKRAMEQARQMEIGALRDELKRVGEELRAIPRLDERVNAAQADARRLNEVLQRLDTIVADLSQRTEDRLQAITYLEEQRRADHQRILALEKEGPEISKRLDTFAARLLPIEDAVPKMRTRLEEGLKPIAEFEKVIQELQAADFRRNQDVKKWAAQAEEIRQEVERLREERQRFLLSFRDATEVLRSLEPFQTRIEGRQNEALELLRVTEERLKRQWEEWQSAQEKERRKWEVSLDERWKHQERSNRATQERFDAILPMIHFHHDQLSALWEVRLADATRTLKTAQGEFAAFTEGVDEQLSLLREKSPKKDDRLLIPPERPR